MDETRSKTSLEDVRKVPVTFNLSEREVAALDKRVDELGFTRSRYARDVLLAALGIEDTARRPAPQRPSRARRQREEGQQ